MEISGRVVHGGPGGAPLARAWVVLHRVTSDRAGGGGAGPVDSVRTDRRGAFALTVAHRDTAAVYVVSSWYDGIAYFSEPVAGTRPRAELGPLLVYDTTSAGPDVHLARRLLTVTRPKRDGARDALEVVEIRNPGTKTRIAPDTLRPTWAGAIPGEAVQFRVGQGDLSAQAVTLSGDRVTVFGPIPPGEPRQLSYAYLIPADVTRLAVPIDQPVGELDLLLEDTAATVSAPDLAALGVQEVEGRHFARYRARTVPAGASVTVAFPAPRGLQPERLVPLVVAAAGLVLGVGFVVALRRQTSDVRRQTSDVRRQTSEKS